MVRQDDCTRQGFIFQCDVLMEEGGLNPKRHMTYFVVKIDIRVDHNLYTDQIYVDLDRSMLNKTLYVCKEKSLAIQLLHTQLYLNSLVSELEAHHSKALGRCISLAITIESELYCTFLSVLPCSHKCRQAGGAVAEKRKGSGIVPNSSMNRGKKETVVRSGIV